MPMYIKKNPLVSSRARESWFKQSRIYSTWGYFYTRYSFFWPFDLKIRSLMIFLYNSSVKIQIPIRPSPAPGDHDLNNFESTIPKNAHRQSSTFLDNCFFKILKYFFSFYSYIKFEPQLRAHSTLKYHDLNTLVLTLHKNVFTSVFSVKLLFEKMIFESYQ